MKILLITEKCDPTDTQRDGGARLVNTIQRALGHSLSIMQFGPKTEECSATWRFDYPFDCPNRFERRLANADFIAECVKAIEQNFTHMIFLHISMQFGLINFPLRKDIEIWTFPMFLTPSYLASGENVPESYLERERLTLTNSKNILTPSYLEKRQLIDFYSIKEEHIHVVPRGVDNRFLVPKIRSLQGTPKFCSIGSIKPQKNILGLIVLFKKMLAKFPGATLRIIGPIQNTKYHAEIVAEIERLGLSQNIELIGYVPPDKLSSAIEDVHLHLSTSTCETFGRSIFETLASGLPNIARSTDNAAAEFLENLPYTKFVDDDDEALIATQEMLSNLSKISAMAIEIGTLYDDEFLSKLLTAKICNKNVIGISDFDGTLFHKEDPEKTLRCITAFRKFPVKVICSARSIEDLLKHLKLYHLEVDWIVGYSGSIVTNGSGQPHWMIPIDLNEVTEFEELTLHGYPIEVEGKLLQMTIPAELLTNVLGLRIEIYQNTAFIANWEASKLRAVHRLLRFINWQGRVCVFGDGIYDSELLTYFDGVLITNFSTNRYRQKSEIVNA